jgi:hypothetical protein
MESSGAVMQLWGMTYQPDVSSRSESAWIAVSAATRGPWRAALAGGVIVGAADASLHLLTGSLTVATPLWFALVAFFLIGGAGALLRGGRDRARNWALSHPLRYALVPGAGAAATVLVTRLLLDFSGAFFNGLLAGLVVTALVGMAGYVARAVHQ